jgi:hypothetical protein
MPDNVTGSKVRVRITLSRAKPRDLRFNGPFLEMFFDVNA